MNKIPMQLLIVLIFGTLSAAFGAVGELHAQNPAGEGEDCPDNCVNTPAGQECVAATGWSRGRDCTIWYSEDPEHCGEKPTPCPTCSITWCFSDPERAAFLFGTSPSGVFTMAGVVWQAAGVLRGGCRQEFFLGYAGDASIPAPEARPSLNLLL